MQVHNIE